MENIDYKTTERIIIKNKNKYLFKILSSPEIIIKMYSFDAFSLKTKESGRKTRRSALRNELLSFKFASLEVK